MIDIICHLLFLHHAHLRGKCFRIGIRSPLARFERVLLQQELFQLVRSIKVGTLRLRRVSSIQNITYVRFEGRHNLLVVQGIPVNSVEPRMGLNVLETAAIRSPPKPFVRIALEKLN